MTIKLKDNLHEKDINSLDIQQITKKYNRRDKVKIALYCGERCFSRSKSDNVKTCFNLVKRWLADESSVKVEELKSVVDEVIKTDDYLAAQILNIIRYSFSLVLIFHNASIRNRGCIDGCLRYARLFAYEDLDFPYREQAETFNLDDDVDLNIFLDFLTDNYPAALIYSRKKFLLNRLAREYLKVIYQ